MKVCYTIISKDLNHMQKESRVKKTMLNAKVNLLCYLASFITAFFTRKVLLDQLGTEFIGFTGTIGSILSFLNLAELGIGTAISYILYKPIANKDQFKINEVISVLGYLYKKIGYAILAGGVVLSFFLPIIFPNTSFPLDIVYIGFYTYLTASLIGYFVNYRAALLSADQRNYIVTGYFQITTTSKVILQMVLAIYFGSFYIYLAIELSCGIINSIILNWKINQVYPWLKCNVKLGHKLLKKYPEIAKYTKQLFAHKIGHVFNEQLTPIFIYAFVSLPIVALYSNYLIITQKIERTIGSVINSAGAAVGNLIAEGDKTKIIKTYKQFLSLRFMVATVFSATIFKLSTPFISIWLGNEYILPQIVVLQIAILSGMAMMRGVIDEFRFGFGIFSDIWAPYVEISILTIVSTILGYKWGLYGVLCGPIVSIFIIVYIWKPYSLFKNGFKLSALIHWRICCKYFLLSLIAFLIADKLYETYIYADMKITNWGTLIVNSSLYVILITSICLCLYLLSSKDFRDILNRVLKAKRNKH